MWVLVKCKTNKTEMKRPKRNETNQNETKSTKTKRSETKSRNKTDLSKPNNHERCTFMYIYTCGYMYFYDMP